MAFRTVLSVAAVACGLLTQSETADAVPSYARQTGYYCSTCHTVQPELTPFGRQFKLNGYTAGGTRCGDFRRVFGSADSSIEWTGANLSAWILPTFTHTAKAVPAGSQPPGYATNDNLDFADASVFLAGQVYCNLGIFSQFSYSRPANDLFLDNTDLRYTGKASVAGNDVVWGVMGNNNPTVQDAWNTVPAWLYPYIPQDISPAPSAAAMLEGTFSGRAASAGAYVWVNNMFYAELSAYRAFDSSILTALGYNPTDGTPRFDGLAPYWRVAVEKTWYEHSLMFGTYGMFANVTPTVGPGSMPPSSALLYPGRSDKYTDIAVDAQYQYIGIIHAFTARAYYLWENQKLDATFFGSGGTAANRASENLQSFNASASYMYDRHISASAGYFNVQGTTDPLYWSFSNTGKPASEGLTFDLAYNMYPYGGPDLWPWLNARIGITYTHYMKFDGSATNYDGTGRNASDNDTTFLYAWIAF